MNPRWAACSLLAVSVVTVAGAVRAADTPAIVRVYVAGSDEAVSGARAAIEDLCSRSNVAVVVRDAAGADEALLATSPAPGLADAYVDLRAGTAPRVVVVEGETRQYLERRTLPDDVSLEISIETVAHVVCAAVESSLATRSAPPPPPPPPPPVRRQATVERPERAPAGARWSSEFALFATAADFGAGLRAGGGVSVGSSRGSGGLRLGGLLSLSGYPAGEVESAGGVASLGLMGARFMPSVEWRATPFATAFVGLGAGADWIRISAGRPPPGAVGRGASNGVDAMVSGMLGLRLRLNGTVAALLALDADADLARHRYVIQTPQGSQSFFEPARVRPVALAGLSLSLDGASPPTEASGPTR